MVKLRRFLSQKTKRRLTLASMIYAYFALSALLATGLAARFAWPRVSKRLGHMRLDDLAAIDLFLANRDGTALEVKKQLWAGGPQGRLASANVYGLPHRGRFFHVLAEDAEGTRYRYELATTGEQERGDLTLFEQNAKGYWIKVLQ